MVDLQGQSETTDMASIGVRTSLRKLTLNQMIVVAGMILAIFVCVAHLSRTIIALHIVNTAMSILLASLACFSALAYASETTPNDRRQLARIAGITAILGIVTWLMTPNSAAAHPIFSTPISGEDYARPAIRIDVRDDSEIFGRAELYLSVQSSHFPRNTYVLFPVNRGDFQGCRSRFIQLPFEVNSGDQILFNLLDDDKLGANESCVLDASRAAGYCLVIAGNIVRPDLSRLLEPAFMSASQVIGNSVVLHFQQNPFENMGVGEFIVQDSRPTSPQEANQIAILNGNYARATVRVYYPIAEESHKNSLN